MKALLSSPLLRLKLAVTAAGLLVAAAVLMALAAFALSERTAALNQALERGELMARVFEDHASRSFDAGALVLTTLAESRPAPVQGSYEKHQPFFSNALLGLNFIRGVALLDGRGKVLVSSDPAEQGLQLDLARLGELPARDGVQLLGVRPGRGLADLVARPGAAPEGLAMILMSRRLSGPDGQPQLMLAVLNPDVFANYQQRGLADIPGRALMASYQGQVFDGSNSVEQAPGASLSPHPVLRDWLPQREHGSYIGQGLGAGTQIVAFRALRGRPIVMLVEQDEHAVLARWREVSAWRALLALGAVLVVAIGALVIYRSLRAREQARVALDQAHQDVALRERELSVLMKSVQELIFRTDAQGVITFVNARWAALSRNPGEQAVGRPLQELVEPICQRRVAALFERRAGAGLRSVEASVRSADGRQHRFHITVVPLRAQGRIVGFAGSAADVSERYAAQQRLRQELAFSSLLLEVSPYPISLLDAQGRYVSVNRAWEAFTGLSRDRILGKAAGFYMSEQDRRLHEARDAQLLEQGGSLRYEASWPHPDGSRRDVVFTKVALRDELGALTGTLNTLIDVSEFRDAERATRDARDAAEQASRAKSEFVANISHELRTPLQSILGFSELGQMRGAEMPRLASMFADIHASGQRMLALVNDLLDVSKIESPIGTLDLEPSDLRELVQSVLRELHPLAERRILQLQSRMPVEPLSAKVDPLRFQQVVRNIVANAIKFSPEGSTIEIEGRSTPQGELHIAVADRGPGIPEKELDSIFEAFVQSSATKDGSGGTGLGLAICRKIIEIHGGRIAASNRPGGGAVFDIYLPMRAGGDTQPVDFVSTIIGAER